nr:hypothetical protein [Pseudomonas sp. BIGb0427]
MLECTEACRPTGPTPEAGRIRFYWSGRNEHGEVEFLDPRGNLLHRQILERPASAAYDWLEYPAPANNNIALIRVIAHDYSLLDNFTLWCR